MQLNSNIRPFSGQIHRLSGLGFSAEDCTKALDICCGQLDDAALWLTQNAAHVPDEKGSLSDSKSTISFDTIEVRQNLK